jgi:hypothetical protein
MNFYRIAIRNGQEARNHEYETAPGHLVRALQESSHPRLKDSRVFKPIYIDNVEYAPTSFLHDDVIGGDETKSTHLQWLQDMKRLDMKSSSSRMRAFNKTYMELTRFGLAPSLKPSF